LAAATISKSSTRLFVEHLAEVCPWFDHH
jgi:hypothetical protein